MEMNQEHSELMESLAPQEPIPPTRKKNLKAPLFSTVALIFITVLLFSAQTYAYFTDRAESDQNRIAAGNLDVSLIEMQETVQGEILYVNNVEIMPGLKVSKIVKIQNTGDLPVYIRIKIEKSINKPENSLPADWREMVSCNVKLDDVNTPEWESYWTYHDGYYYYNKPLEKGVTTVPLFDTVCFDSQMGNEFTNSEIRLTICCEATQSNGNSDSPLTAIGWPAANNNGTSNASEDTTN